MVSFNQEVFPAHLKNGFFHFDIESSSRKCTSFITPHGQFEFLKVPFGLCNSPAVFQKFINFSFRNLIREEIVIVYVDDLVIPSKSLEEGLDRIRLVLRVSAENGSDLIGKQFKFYEEKLSIWDTRLGTEKLHRKLIRLKQYIFSYPTTVKRLQSFLGLASYFRKFIPNFD